MLGVYAYVTFWLCDLQFQCGSNIWSVIYDKYLYSDIGSGHLVILGRDSAGLMLESAKTELFQLMGDILRRWS